eukprot:g18588.t1
MPKAAETESDSVDPYAMAFALLVNQTLDSNLRIYVEYRSCCRAGLAPGWDSDNAVQSLVLWKSWEQAGVDPSRVVNVMSALQQLTKLYGSSVTSVEAAAIDVSFSDVCKYGETPCVDFNSLEANGTYGGLTPLELIDAVIRPAMLKQEVEINARVQQALYYGFEIIAFNAMPLISARSYGHRGNLNWALGCESCLMSALGRRYGARERSQLAAPVPVLAATEYSVIVELAEGSAISSYMWMTSGWNRRVDPVMWRLEVRERTSLSTCENAKLSTGRRR